MMPTTTIRLPDELKDRIARLAERTGITSHALMLGAIAEHVEAEERRNAFHDTAEQRFAKIIESGETIPWSQMRTYLEQRLTDKPPAKPVPRKISR